MTSARTRLDVEAFARVGRNEEAAARATAQGLIVERLWEWLSAGDPLAGALAPDSKTS
jgi:hypothetical protein